MAFPVSLIKVGFELEVGVASSGSLSVSLLSFLLLTLKSYSASVSWSQTERQTEQKMTIAPGVFFN